MKPTLRDVAKRAGVSTTAVSMALSEKGRISDSTRQKVLQAADELNYKLKVRINKITDFSNVGVLVSTAYEWSFVWPFIRPLIEQLEKELICNELNIVMVPIELNAQTGALYKKILSTGSGAIVSIHFRDDVLFKRLENSGIPVIAVMDEGFHNRYNSVCVDDFQGAYTGGIHLIELGHKRIAYAGVQRPDLPTSNDRLTGLKTALNDSGIELPKKYNIDFKTGHMEKLREDLYEVFNCPESNRPTAVFCLDDDLALRVILGLKELNLTVPEDVSIIAPGDILDYKLPFSMQITTMQIDTKYMGKIVAQMLLNRITNTQEPQHGLKIQQHLIERGSCRQI